MSDPCRIVALSEQRVNTFFTYKYEGAGHFGPFYTFGPRLFLGPKGPASVRTLSVRVRTLSVRVRTLSVRVKTRFG